ncbi:hypothetical protein DPMN_142355 [Dreissena polymorpha]|uniref:Uncharacterized protein n=1 Tax=Dreissena polymorpha TaxID=45954 RepID=A0A9D4GF79_DREPO|nr:hypothetical protein DPMN_142355 [Dreissena polymorpha]
MGKNNLGYEKNGGTGKLGSEIKSKNNYIWGFPSVTAFEVPPGSFVSCSCPERFDNFERGREPSCLYVYQ